MPVAVFLDTTVLCNFAAVRRLDLVEGLLRGRGRWTEAVAFEVSQSAGHLPDLRGVSTEGWLGEPLEITDAREIREIDRIRRAVFGGGRRNLCNTSARRRPVTCCVTGADSPVRHG